MIIIIDELYSLELSFSLNKYCYMINNLPCAQSDINVIDIYIMSKGGDFGLKY